MIFLSPAKVNLTLQILGKDKKDNYHFLRSIFDPVSFYDLLDINITDRPGIFVRDIFGRLRIPAKKNIIYKAAAAMIAGFGLKKGIAIDLFKYIPDGAGLGGGSSNAATTLLAIKKLFKLKISASGLINIASKLGSDVPFFIHSGRALVRGKGEKISLIKKGKTLWYVLVCPRIKVATKQAYRWFDSKMRSSNLTIKKDFNILLNSPSKKAIVLYNDFEEVVFRKKRQLKAVKLELLKTGCADAALSGSGSTVFALYETKRAAISGYEIIKRKFRNATVVMAHSI